MKIYVAATYFDYEGYGVPDHVTTGRTDMYAYLKERQRTKDLNLKYGGVEVWVWVAGEIEAEYGAVQFIKMIEQEAADLEPFMPEVIAINDPDIERKRAEQAARFEHEDPHTESGDIRR